MKVVNFKQRQEKPDECDRCGHDTKNLKRFEHFGPGCNVNWLCPYCSLIFAPDEDQNAIKRTIAGMFNELERRLILHIKYDRLHI